MIIARHIRLLAVVGLLMPVVAPASADAGQRFFKRQQIIQNLQRPPQQGSFERRHEPRSKQVRRRAPQPNDDAVATFRAPQPDDDRRVSRRRAPQPEGPVVFRRAPQPESGPDFGEVQQFRAPQPNDPARVRRHRRSDPGPQVASASKRGLDVRRADDDGAISTATNYPGNGRIDLEILFDYDSDRIDPGSVKQLIELGEALNDPSLANARIVVAGHTDATGGNGYNLDLSLRRARAVTDFLVNYAGVGPDRLAPEGFGEDYLKYPDAPQSGQNRRVEIINLGEAG